MEHTTHSANELFSKMGIEFRLGNDSNSNDTINKIGLWLADAMTKFEQPSENWKDFAVIGDCHANLSEIAGECFCHFRTCMYLNAPTQAHAGAPTVLLTCFSEFKANYVEQQDPEEYQDKYRLENINIFNAVQDFKTYNYLFVFKYYNGNADSLTFESKQDFSFKNFGLPLSEKDEEIINKYFTEMMLKRMHAEGIDHELFKLFNLDILEAT